MVRRLFVLGLLAVSACRSSRAAPDAGQSLPPDLAVQLAFEEHLSTWEPRGEGVAFNYGSAPNMRKEGALADVGTQFVVMPGETLVLEESGFNHTLTLRRVTKDHLEFDFTYRSRSAEGELETARGAVVLTRDFDPKWRVCASTADCVIIPAYCGGYLAVSARSQALARSFYRRSGAIKKCSGGTMTPPVAACVEGQCRPGATFPR